MDVIKKALLVGLGVISLTKEKAEEMVDDLIRRGRLCFLTSLAGLGPRAQNTALEYAEKLTIAMPGQAQPIA